MRWTDSETLCAFGFLPYSILGFRFGLWYRITLGSNNSAFQVWTEAQAATWPSVGI